MPMVISPHPPKITTQLPQPLMRSFPFRIVPVPPPNQWRIATNLTFCGTYLVTFTFTITKQGA